MNRPRTRAALLAALALTLAACGSAEPSDTVASEPAAAPSSAVEAPTTDPASDRPFGAGCSAVPAEGEGSPAGMADDPVATAVGNNAALSRLAQAVAAADLVDTLNGADDITVLAPADQAFDAMPAEALQGLLADTPQLTALLTHHVLEGRLGPGELAGEQTTINGDTVTIEGSGEDFRIPAEGTVLGRAPATVVCGNVQTANATVYLIDQVLIPPAS